MRKSSSHHLPKRRREAGVGLVTAIFLLVVLAGLGVALVSVFGTQQASTAMDEQGARAFQAARAGIEWGLFQQSKGSCTAATTFPMPPGSTLSGFSVTVKCSAAAAPGTAGQILYRISSVACNLPRSGNTGCPNTTNSPDYVQRQLEAAR